MSLPIRYSPMASYFWLSIIFLTPQVLRHAPRWRDLLWHLHKPSHNHQWLYPIPIDWPGTTLETSHMTHGPCCYISFLSLFLFTWHVLPQPNQSQVIAPCGWDFTICFTTHRLCAHFTYHLYLRLLYLLQKRRNFSPELRLKFILSHHFAFLHLVPSPYFALPTYFTLSHCPKPSSHTTSHSLNLHQETISLLPNCTPQNHIGYTLRSLAPPIFVTS